MKKTKKKIEPMFRFRGKNLKGISYLIYQVGDYFITKTQDKEIKTHDYKIAHAIVGGRVPSYIRGLPLEEVK